MAAINPLESALPDADAAPEDAASPRPQATTIVARLYRQNASKMKRYLAFRLRDREDGADAAHDVFLKLWRYESRGELREQATSYLYSAAQTAVTDTERRRISHAHYQTEDIDEHAIAEASPGHEERQHWREALAHFVEGIKALPEVTGNVFLLSYFEGLTYQEIAQSLRISERTVERHIVRAMVELRERMKDYL